MRKANTGTLGEPYCGPWIGVKSGHLIPGHPTRVKAHRPTVKVRSRRGLGLPRPAQDQLAGDASG